MLRGFAARPGYSRHPVFAGANPKATLVNTQNYKDTLGRINRYDPFPRAYFPRGKGTELRLDPDGFFTNGHHPGAGYCCECTWKDTPPDGRVIADVYDSTLGALGGYAGIVEYGGGEQGKVLVAGAMPFDLSPGKSFQPDFHPLWKCFVRGLAYNMICYLGGSETFARDEAEAARGGRAAKVLHYLPETWKF